MIRRIRSESAFTSLQFAVMAFFTMLVFAAAVNLVAMQYQRGAVRVAVDEGARLGASVGHSTDDCERLADAILRDGGSGLLRGSLGSGIDIRCDLRGDHVVATAVGSAEWWIGGLPDIDFTVEGRAIVETFVEGP